LLLLVPGQSEWLAFRRWQGQLEAQRLAVPPQQAPLAAVQGWLASFSDLIARASQLSIMAYGRARSIDFAALELAGAPLVTQLPVVYRLGLQARGTRPLAAPLALVVGDPGGDLPGARQEATRVAEWLSPQRVQLRLGADAERSLVIEELGRAASFHYAGHGEAAKEDDLSGLPLAGGARLTTSDVIALPSVPEHVVLAACDVGRSEEPAGASGWSLAHAFVMAGARDVIAPVRPIPDRDALSLQSYFYEALRAPDAPSWARALARAQTRAAALGVKDWAMLRVFTP
jgi:CHAT domain-containing protein